MERQLKYTSNIIEVVNKVKLREEQDKEKDREEGRAETKEVINRLNKLALDLSLAFI